MKIKVIGAGGIGGALLPPLSRYLNFNGTRAVVTVIDGDCYEEKNRERQIFHEIGNKAEVTVDYLKSLFPKVVFRARSEYLTPESAEYLLEDGDIILLCVDNHRTRKNVSDFCEGLENIILISGGNDYTDGNIQVFLKKDGQNITLPITNKFHPEIASPKDRSPHEIGCEEQVESQPQLIFANFFIAGLMLNAFYANIQGRLTYDEVYADILTNNCRAAVRRQ